MARNAERKSIAKWRLSKGLYIRSPVRGDRASTTSLPDSRGPVPVEYRGCVWAIREAAQFISSPSYLLSRCKSMLREPSRGSLDIGNDVRYPLHEGYLAGVVKLRLNGQ